MNMQERGHSAFTKQQITAWPQSGHVMLMGNAHVSLYTRYGNNLIFLEADVNVSAIHLHHKGSPTSSLNWLPVMQINRQMFGSP